MVTVYHWTNGTDRSTNVLSTGRTGNHVNVYLYCTCISAYDVHVHTVVLL